MPYQTAADAIAGMGMLIAISGCSHDSAVARTLRGRAADLLASHLHGGIVVRSMPLLPLRVGAAPTSWTAAVGLDRLGLLFARRACKSSQTDGICDN